MPSTIGDTMRHGYWTLVPLETADSRRAGGGGQRRRRPLSASAAARRLRVFISVAEEDRGDRQAGLPLVEWQEAKRGASQSEEDGAGSRGGSGSYPREGRPPYAVTALRYPWTYGVTVLSVPAGGIVRTSSMTPRSNRQSTRRPLVSERDDALNWLRGPCERAWIRGAS